MAVDDRFAQGSWNRRDAKAMTENASLFSALCSTDKAVLILRLASSKSLSVVVLPV